MLSKPFQLKRADIPEGWSKEGADFINKVNSYKFYQRIVFAN